LLLLTGSDAVLDGRLLVSSAATISSCQSSNDCHERAVIDRSNAVAWHALHVVHNQPNHASADTSHGVLLMSFATLCC